MTCYCKHCTHVQPQAQTTNSTLLICHHRSHLLLIYFLLCIYLLPFVIAHVMSPCPKRSCPTLKTSSSQPPHNSSQLSHSPLPVQAPPFPPLISHQISLSGS